MKITTLIAAASLAVASTAAVAQNTAVTTDAGEVVMIEKNQGSAAGAVGSSQMLLTVGPAVIAGFIVAIASATGS